MVSGYGSVTGSGTDTGAEVVLGVRVRAVHRVAAAADRLADRAHIGRDHRATDEATERMTLLSAANQPRASCRI